MNLTVLSLLPLSALFVLMVIGCGGDSPEIEDMALLETPTIVASPSGGSPEIEDMALRRALWSELNKPRGSEFTKDELLDVTRLEFGPNDTGGVQLKSLKGIEALENLVALSLKDTQVTDISSLSELQNFRYLRINNNYGGEIGEPIDLAPLSGLSNLEQLMILMSKTSDISPLAGLKKLHLLQVHLTRVSDISAVAGLPALNEVSLHAGFVYDFAPLLESGLGTGDSIKIVGKWQQDTNGPDVVNALAERGVGCSCP